MNSLKHTIHRTRSLLHHQTRSQSIRSISGAAQEIRIPVAYGHIAGKAWGDPGGKPILGLHGWLDNAGTFDHLAPLINEVRLKLLFEFKFQNYNLFNANL